MRSVSEWRIYVLKTSGGEGIDWNGRQNELIEDEAKFEFVCIYKAIGELRVIQNRTPKSASN